MAFGRKRTTTDVQSIRDGARCRVSPAGGEVALKDRLLLLFADLESYGITAHEAWRAHAAEGHLALAAEVAARFPNGLGSYVFWTGTDDALFSPTGQLRSALALHCSTEYVVPAVLAAAPRYGVAVKRTPNMTGHPVVTVLPDPAGGDRAL
jgi:hypothetical protein